MLFHICQLLANKYLRIFGLFLRGYHNALIFVCLTSALLSASTFPLVVLVVLLFIILIEVLLDHGHQACFGNDYGLLHFTAFFELLDIAKHLQTLRKLALSRRSQRGHLELGVDLLI